MYTERERTQLLEKVAEYLRSDDNFEGLVQIGSGVQGFRDIYSDIDLMAGCRDVEAAAQKLHALFSGLGAVYIHPRRWSESVLGFSAYWENGLSVDISFMPRLQIPVLSERIAIVFSKTAAFTSHIRNGLEAYRPREPDASAHHLFIYALRRCEIALLREEYIYADMALAEARAILLSLASGRADPKRFSSLDPVFLAALEQTYPAARNREAITRARERMRILFMECSGMSPEDPQLKLIGCFE